MTAPLGQLGRYTPVFHALLRIVTGLLFLQHGTQKLFGWPAGAGAGPVEVMSMMGLAGVIELVVGLMLVVGFFVRPAALLGFLEMIAAYVMAHASQAALPIQNQGELALLYAFVFLYFAGAGAGIWSVDGAGRDAAAADRR